MPSLTFILPHWMYWGGLFLFPIVAMLTVRRQRRIGLGAGVSLASAYLFWLTGGFVGIHRFYLRSWWGALYIPLFVGILLVNVQGRAAREVSSRTHSALQIAEYNLDHAQGDQKEGIEGAAEKIVAAQAEVARARPVYEAAVAEQARWFSRAGWLAALIALMLAVDAVLMPRLTRRCIAREGGQRPLASMAPVIEPKEESTHTAPGARVHTRVTNWIDQLNGFVGEYVSYWSLIAVFVYYYEVLARYVFNSPTNWAHESMFLMFGMQYLLSGGFAFREDSHVRVDVLYVLLPRRTRVILDLITSVFFFLFNGALLVTGYIFVRDAIGVWEVSFTEWAIQYWPVKIAMPLGALLILLQGSARVYKNITYLRTKEA
jgi:TRAP-type mannitol/chloroaromatic compound transport system permease small subunit